MEQFGRIIGRLGATSVSDGGFGLAILLLAFATIIL